jgi:hypothetical protein
LERCVDLVWKLYWELVRLHHATLKDVIDMKCFAFNAAVMAWQSTDRVYGDMTQAQRARHGIASPLANLPPAKKHLGTSDDPIWVRTGEIDAP